PEGRRGVDLRAPGRAVLDRTTSALLVRPHLGPHARGRALVPAPPDPQRPAARRGVRGARSLRAAWPARRQARPDLVFARGRALASRAGPGGLAERRIGNR